MDQDLIKLLDCIKKLRTTDKIKINEISILAELFKNSDETCKHVADYIMDRILYVSHLIKIFANLNNFLQVESDVKLSIFYAMDSILKNICEPYKKHFSKNIVHVFVNSFKSVSCNLFTLQNNENLIFGNKINRIDSFCFSLTGFISLEDKHDFDWFRFIFS